MAHSGLCHDLEESADIRVSESFPSELPGNPEDPCTFRTSFAAQHREKKYLFEFFYVFLYAYQDRF